ncbi:hypothetical protein MRX96_015692 [Rhipicephalus microplus]
MLEQPTTWERFALRAVIPKEPNNVAFTSPSGTSTVTRLETTEPCLDCTCQKGVLVCYLRVCTTVGTPAPGCFTTKEAGQCCPSVFCSASPFVSNEASADVRYVAETTSSNGVNAPVRKPLYDDEHGNSFEDALQGGGRDSIMFVSSTPIPFELHHSFDFQNLDTTSGACLDEASLYAEGSAMLSFQLLAITATAFAAQSVASSPSATWRWRTASRSSTSQYDCCPTSYACTKRPNATTPLPPPSTPAAATASTSTSTPTTTSTSTTTTTTEGPVVIPIHEDAIIRSSIPTQPPVISSITGAYPRRVNTDTRDTMEDNCFVDAHLYFNGEVINNGNLCEVCRCYYGRELCKQESCPLPPSRACISEAAPGFCCPKYTCRCNIYGRLYVVNEVVRELSSECKTCTCTAFGVQCSETC